MNAISAFDEGVSEVKILLALSERPDADLVASTETSDASFDGSAPASESIFASRGALQSEQDNAVRRASVVLLVSHFESYLKSTAEEFIDALSTGQLEAGRIPVGIRELHTMPKIEEIASTGDSVQRHVLLKKLSTISQLWTDASKPARGTLDARLFGRQVTSARPDKIDSLFTLMGSTYRVCDGDIDIPNGDGDMTTSNIRLSLNDVVKCRNDIAHGDSSRKPTATDVARYIDFLTSLASRLERLAQGLTSAYD